MALQQKVEQLNNQILQGDILGAFDNFYADDVVMQDNEDEPRKGRQACREYEEQFVNALKDVHDVKVKNVAVNEEDNTAMVEWLFDMTFKDGNRDTRNQVAVQKWNDDGKIIHEKFYYGQ